ncbi:hypothetical protein DFJ73DRAFT_960849 [Zopfochytrium polystomum]|nr:hypothetical protein DFJ73DRAFT_960849 [Zopfochytrium polystomum]
MRGTPFLTAAAVALSLSGTAVALPAPTTDTSGTVVTDACANILKHSVPVGNTSYLVFTPEVAIACLNSFNITAETRQKQVKNLKSYYELYPFLDLAKDSKAPLFPLKVDIDALLDSIAADNTLTTEFAFQTAMYKAVNSLNDAHMSYVGTCFTKFTAMLPFVFASQHDPTPGKPPKIIVKDTFTSGSALFKTAGFPAANLAKALDKFWIHGLRGSSAANFTGFVVQEINGLDPVDFIVKNTLKDSISKSPETRFNNALRSYRWTAGNPAGRDGSLYYKTVLTSDMPNVLRMTLLNPATGNTSQIHAPWAVITTSASSLVSADTYYAKYCAPPKTASLVARDDAPVPGISDPELPEALLLPDEVTITGGVRRFKRTGDGKVESEPVDTDALALQAPLADRERATTAVDLDKPVVADANGAFYLVDGTTGVWVLSTFSPADTSDAGIDKWIGTITTGLSTLEKAGATKLIIDVTGNGGGYICLGLAIAQYLFPNTTITPVLYDVRRTTVLEELFKITYNSDFHDSYFALDGMLTANGTQMKTVEDLFEPGLSTVRGGVAGKYSNRISLDCSSNIKPYILNATLFNQLSKGWDNNHLAIVSNGRCGSTCAIYTRTLRANYGVKTFTYGGNTGKAFQPTSFEGGQSANALDVLDSVEGGFAATRYNTSLPRDAFPQAFTLPSTVGIAFWEAYSQFEKTNLPLEFEPQPAEGHLSDADATDPVSVWRAGAAKLRWRASAGTYYARYSTSSNSTAGVSRWDEGLPPQTLLEGVTEVTAESVLKYVEFCFAATNYTSPLPREAFPSAFVLPVELGIAHWEAY